MGSDRNYWCLNNNRNNIPSSILILSGYNDRMGLLAGGTVGYLILKDSENYAVIKTKTYEKRDTKGMGMIWNTILNIFDD